MNLAVLAEHGIDYNKGLSRCMNDPEFYEKLLGMFLCDDSFSRGKKAYEAKNFDLMFKCVHELKGACGNASLVGLYNAVVPLVDLLRENGVTNE